MKLTITNNGSHPFSVLYTDLYKIYTPSDEGIVGDIVTLEPDTSVTLDNVEAIHQISPGSYAPPELLSEADLEYLNLDGEGDSDFIPDEDIEEESDDEDSETRL